MNDEYYMSLALQEAQKAYEADEVPIGCVIVNNNQVLASTHNHCQQTGDPCAHAELVAIRECVERYGGKVLLNSSLYVTVEPCSMCAGAIVLAKIPRVIYGALENKTGAVHTLFNILTHPKLNHRAQVRGGVLEHECCALMQSFFINKRGS